MNKYVWLIGAGSMRYGIAQLCAQYNLSVILIDPNPQALTEAWKNMLWSLEKLFKKSQITEKPDVILKRIKFYREPPIKNQIDYLIECVPEDITIKKKVLSQYSSICQKETIFASCTSAIPIGKLAESINGPDRVIGTHFANISVMQKLVEVIPCLRTSSDTVEKTRRLLIHLEREIVDVKVDTAGFIMNRIYLSAAAEAMRLLEIGVASIKDIDRSMRIWFGWTKGPLEAADLAGLDVIRDAMFSIYQDTGNSFFYPPQVLKRLVEAGNLGRKCGVGFYEYTKKIMSKDGWNLAKQQGINAKNSTFHKK